MYYKLKQRLFYLQLMALNKTDINSLKAAFFGEAEIMFALLDKDLNFIDVNTTALKTFNFKREDIIGKNITEATPDNISSGRNALLKEVIRTGKTLLIDEMKSHPSLGNFYFRVKAFKVGDGLGLVTNNITDIKQAYEKLAKTETEVRNFAQHLNKVLEDERAHIAREIHDDVGQQLAGIKIGLSFLKKSDGANGITEEKVNAMISDIDSTIQSLRKIATELRPGILDTLGLISSIKWLANEFENKTGVKCKVETNLQDKMFEKDISTCFFRICQESLTNISKHALATEVKIKAQQDNKELLLEISDNGKGISSGKLDNPFSMGLLGMRERANIIGAELRIISEKNKGTIVQLKTGHEIVIRK